MHLRKTLPPLIFFSGASSFPLFPYGNIKTAIAASCQELAQWFGLPPILANGEWSGWSNSYLNNRFVAHNAEVSSNAISSLTQRCKISFEEGVSAPPALLGDIAYFPTWSGAFVAYNYVTCQAVWQTNITAYLIEYGVPTVEQLSFIPVSSRTSPQIDQKQNVLYAGSLLHALLFAMDLRSGTILGQIPINDHPLAIITQSPTFYNGKVFVGASSSEISVASIPGYPCCNFTGNFGAYTFNRSTGTFARDWLVNSIENVVIGPGGWAGASVWGSQPSIDVQRSQVFYGTGNM
ncbi:hypothetical protein BAUCODRAFT_33851 [Baudoinia panamericana UAMH 10762]|uniref:Uncharacterized protein n=1 Tax=Baudoinia panamericana (strain UAMH 10762) TaxID=717646 RepID=M2NBH0_BAUPA|nr:uncharacterized protein BAUCODRAFT_33851 [Baudoinia panamericana UAMH 10762]EMC96489.1 hypothetical protein BAUCODRAFT_33851 [Baudoinia panamericana UAMH 10762]